MKRARFKMVKLTTHRYPRRFTGLTLVVILLGSFLYTGPALAATVTVSATVNGGPVDISASATFPPDESGNLYVYRDSKLIGGNAGSGTITWTGTIDGAGLTNGEHTARATAGGAEATNTFIIDNPVSVTVNAPSLPQAPMDVTGTAQFLSRTSTENYTGQVKIFRRRVGYTDWSSMALNSNTFYEPQVTFSSQNMGGLIDVATWINCDWEIKSVAIAPNNATKEDIQVITIDNPISISSSAPSKPTAPMDVTGTARFIARKSTEDYTGQVKIYRRRVGYTDWSSTALSAGTFYEPQVNFSSQNMSGLIDVATWINCDWEIKSVAIAPVYGTKEDIQVITIDNTPKITASCPRYVSGDFDIMGSAVFTETLSGNKGTLYIKIDSQSTSGALTKTYVMGDSAGFSYSEMAGQMLNADTLGHGEHVAYIRAQAKNGVRSDWLAVPFRTGPPEADGSGNLKMVIPE